MANKSTFINDLTEGSVMKRLIRFTLPLMLANLLQVCYNLVDMFFVGQYAGTDALSAVSISSNVTMLMFFCFMGIATGGQILVKNIIPKHMDCITAKLVEMGVEVEEREDTLLVRRSGPLQKANVKTMPYPGFPTDMQPQLSLIHI